MKIKESKVLILNILFLLSLLPAFSQKENKAPNIIFILADDLGYGDVAAFNKNGKIKTPNIDKLANSGLIFTDAHSSAAVCTPSRYGILTGRYNWRSTLKSGVLVEYGSPIIDSKRTTMASMLKKQGYQTACIGKWHLGFNWSLTNGNKPIDNAKTCNIDFTKPVNGGPTDVGFDYFFGLDAPNYPPYCFIENKQLLGVPNQFYPIKTDLDCREGRGIKDWNLVEILPTLENKALNYIDKAAQNGKPFFLYLPITAPHTPIVPTEKFIEKSGLNRYADFVMQVDDYVGNILETLKKNNILDNTIIVFTSDNGCSPVANFAQLNKKEHNSNATFRGHKADIFEGGHRVPCIVQWPNRIKPNQVSTQTICLNDFMATFANISKYSLSDNEAEDSYTLLPLFLKPNQKKSIREATVHQSMDGSFSIRKGKWKLILCSGSGGWSSPRPGVEENGLAPVQLYNLENDLAETQNLQAKYPLIVKDLTNLMKEYIKNGRSTKGQTQKNDGEFLKERMTWI